MRCTWATISELDQKYHDEEWGVPCFDDQKLFEILTLEVMQAGLSWSTILKKREGFREAFNQFEIHKVSQFTKNNIEHLLQNPKIIRHRQKIEATIQNAKIILQLQNQYGSFHEFLWSKFDHTHIINHWETMEEVPSSTPLTDQLCKEFKKLGFKFIGPTTLYSFLQASGIINDHLDSCPFKHK